MERILKYIIHEHDAVRAGKHYDFRMEIPNKKLIASFALPKAQVPQNIGDKVLAVRVNDHGQYFLFIDNLEIPKGSYGHGTMKSIQKGRLLLEGWSDDYITFQIPSGDIMSGRFALIRFKKNDTKIKEQLWILTKIKEKNNDLTSSDVKKSKK